VYTNAITCNEPSRLQRAKFPSKSASFKRKTDSGILRRDFVKWIAVLSRSECVIDFHVLDFELNDLETDGEATIGRFVDYQCDILSVCERINCVSGD
jgi:hypothetical protein